MFFRKQKEIDRLNARCSELAGMVRDKNNKLKEERKNNLLILEENKEARQENSDLRCEIDELKGTLKRINNLIICNQYDNNQAIKNKIIELTSDYQSIC
jgi:predicted nuclease with TOPRIM domain